MSVWILTHPRTHSHHVTHSQTPRQGHRAVSHSLRRASQAVSSDLAPGVQGHLPFPLVGHGIPMTQNRHWRCSVQGPSARPACARPGFQHHKAAHRLHKVYDSRALSVLVCCGPPAPLGPKHASHPERRPWVSCSHSPFLLPQPRANTGLRGSAWS